MILDSYELATRYDRAKSFYGKAHILIKEDGVYLKSYDTIVAKITEDGQAEVYGGYSQTTLRHIKEFLRQHGFKANTKKQILSDYKGAKYNG